MCRGHQLWHRDAASSARWAHPLQEAGTASKAVRECEALPTDSCGVAVQAASGCGPGALPAPVAADLRRQQRVPGAAADGCPGRNHPGAGPLRLQHLPCAACTRPVHATEAPAAHAASLLRPGHTLTGGWHCARSLLHSCGCAICLRRLDQSAADCCSCWRHLLLVLVSACLNHSTAVSCRLNAASHRHSGPHQSATTSYHSLRLPL